MVYPIILLIGGVGTEVLFKGLVCSLSLAIRLWVEGSAELRTDLEQGGEGLRILGGKDRSTV